MHQRRPFAISIYVCATSLFFAIVGILLLCLWSVLYDAILRSNLVLKPGSNAYNVWVKNPVPLSLKLHVFNWTNPEEIYNSTAKLKFEQLGPYVYSETKEKSNITWNSNNTVTFRHLKKWWYEQEASNGSILDPFTTVNPVALSAAFAARNWHYLVKKGLSVSLRSMTDTVHITRPVGEVLFDGYIDPLLTMASKMPFLAKSGMPSTEKFGWFHGRNGSVDFEGVFNMDTGVTGQIGQLRNWKYSDHTPYYPETCGRFEGASAGDFFPGELTKTSIVKLFSSDLCRYMELEFEKEVEINGLVGYKYSAGDRFLDNGTKIPENKCFCDGDCMPSGALNVSNCRHGSPAFVSLPHFYKADPYYLRGIEGVVPDPKKSDFYMIFEPQTGVPLQVAARLQLNLRLQSVEHITLYQNLPTVYVPVLYFEQTVTLPEDMTFSLKLLVNFKVICQAIGITFLSIGILIVSCMCYKICTMKLTDNKKPKSKTIIREELPLTQ